MHDATTRKALLLPLAQGEGGTIVGLAIDDQGVTPYATSPLEEGRPIMGDTADLSPIPGTPWVRAEITPGPGSRSGPAMVNSPAYRDGYDRIFGKNTPVAEA